MSIKGVSIQLMIGEREEASFSIKEIESSIRKAASMTGIRRLLFWNAGAKKITTLSLQFPVILV